MGGDGAGIFLEAAGLFLAPFLHESIAFVGGAFLIDDGRMSPALCLTILLAGVIASDLGIYGLGALARRHPRIAALLPRGQQPGVILDRQLVWLIPVCRFVPGLLFTTFATCGLLGLSFRRFTIITVLTAAVYTPLMLYAVLRFGGTVATPGNILPWIGVLAALFAVMTLCRWLVACLTERMPKWRISAGN